jgi:hypothetical protein
MYPIFRNKKRDNINGDNIDSDNIDNVAFSQSHHQITFVRFNAQMHHSVTPR